MGLNILLTIYDTCYFILEEDQGKMKLNELKRKQEWQNWQQAKYVKL